MYFSKLFAVASAALLLPVIVASPITTPFAPIDLARRGQLLKRASQDLYLDDDDDHQVLGEVKKVFDAIKAIPAEVLEEGDEAADEWFKAHGYRTNDKRGERYPISDGSTRG